MILIADSSALITLSIVDKLDILEKLFGEVYIPKAVYEETIKKNKQEANRLKDFSQGKIKDISTKINFNISLGKGESEAIILYKEVEADFLLCDDKKAKNFAKSFNINVIGSFGVLLKAKEKGLISEIAPLIDIIKNSDIYLSDSASELILKVAGE